MDNGMVEKPAGYGNATACYLMMIMFELGSEE